MVSSLMVYTFRSRFRLLVVSMPSLSVTVGPQASSIKSSQNYLFVYTLTITGSSLVRSGKIDGGVVVRVLLAVIMAGSGFGMAIPLSNAVRGARVAAYEVFALIDRKSALDPTDQSGEKLEHIEGTISFKNVSFAYPTRSEVGDHDRMLTCALSNL